MFKYKINILQLLKDCGYTTYRLRMENILGQATITDLNQGKMVGLKSFEVICEITGLDIGDIITYEKNN